MQATFSDSDPRGHVWGTRCGVGHHGHFERQHHYSDVVSRKTFEEFSFALMVFVRGDLMT